LNRLLSDLSDEFDELGRESLMAVVPFMVGSLAGSVVGFFVVWSAATFMSRWVDTQVCVCDWVGLLYLGNDPMLSHCPCPEFPFNLVDTLEVSPNRSGDDVPCDWFFP
jgi:hypothetical protein